MKVLLLALSKRHRVEYGAHPSGLRRMAVPYRAKDVAAERAEFGHPDVAMMLTILTRPGRELSSSWSGTTVKASRMRTSTRPRGLQRQVGCAGLCEAAGEERAAGCGGAL